MPIEEMFLKRMFEYDVNKLLPELLKSSKFDYLMIDFFSLQQRLIKLTKNGDAIFINNHKLEKVYEYLINNPAFYDDIEMISSVNDLNENLITQGLRDFAEWLKKYFNEEKIIINYPIYNTEYQSLDGKIHKYSEEQINRTNKFKKIVYGYSDYFCELLPNAHRFVPQINDSYSINILNDSGLNFLPSPVHNSLIANMEIGKQLLSILGLNYGNMSDWLKSSYEGLYLRYLICYQTLKKTKESMLISLNYYFNTIYDSNKHIVIVSAKHEANNFLHKFNCKRKIGLSMPINRHQSYIAVSYLREKFVIENSSDNKQEYTFEIDGLKISIVSGGHPDNISSIQINGTEYSPNRRGLNFCILDCDSLKVVDSFFCDLCCDEFLLIERTRQF